MDSVEKLKELLVNAADLSQPLNYFFELMDQNVVPESKDHQAVQNIQEGSALRVVIKAIEQTILQKIGRKVQICDQEFFEIPDQHFFHGICVTPDDPMPIMVLYFGDIQTGIFGLTEAGAKNQLFRFALKQMH